ncbi:YdaU family protein [Terrimonas sp. NA20]|uniref:YdaU family protein n=1 Tax=Terrimonas ginsenosidimutans TaxID=2908004 RepID=A0ABS9KRD4_9BACT|nr:YdaU family protein [Terrimonas ginsenosidimutans]MCG2614875.1 YdaU family protein [Terrimonas ginsenosidimutans]
MALPYINLYIGDVIKDTNLLSPEAFGGYVRLLFKMHEASPRGVVKYDLPTLCRVFAADTPDKNAAILEEILNPAYNIFDSSVDAGVYTLINRRMVRESKVSQARSEAGKKGAEATNSKNKKNQQTADQFDAANTSSNNAANKSSKKGQNYNSNINSNSGNSLEGGTGEELPIYVVPQMLTVLRKHRPRYIYRQNQDFPALRSIAETIASNEGIEDITNPSAVDSIVAIWDALVAFMLTDSLYKDFQITQIEKYFQAIASKFSSSLEAKPGKEDKKNGVQANMNTAQNAAELLKRKYEGGGNV